MRSRSLQSLVCCLLLPACGWLRSPRDANDADDEALAKHALLMADTKTPSLFLTPEFDAPVFGFASPDAKLVARPDPVENGRIAVRFLGRLHVEAYVPDGSVELYVRETKALPGTAVVLRAGDRVGLIGPRNDARQHEVAVRVRVGEAVLGPYRGRLPAELLSANMPEDPELLAGGIIYQLPAGTALPIFDSYRGELLTLVPPLQRDLSVTVVRSEGDWLRVRLGSGPCLEGLTDVPLHLLGKQAAPLPAAQAPHLRASPTQVPWRIAETAGPLVLLSAGTKLRFRKRVVAILRAEGWARALSALDADEVEVLAAVDEQVTVRAVAPASALTQVEESVFHVAPASGPGHAAALASAL